MAVDTTALPITQAQPWRAPPAARIWRIGRSPRTRRSASLPIQNFAASVSFFGARTFQPAFPCHHSFSYIGLLLVPLMGPETQRGSETSTMPAAEWLHFERILCRSDPLELLAEATHRMLQHLFRGVVRADRLEHPRDENGTALIRAHSPPKTQGNF